MQSARALFAERGYEGTSIRAVAEAAGVDPALVHHYFGTKEGLFHAALEIPIDQESLIEQIVSAGPDGAAQRLVRTFLQVWDGPETGPAMVGFLRRVLSQQGTLDLVRDFIGASMLRTTADRLLAGADPDDARVRIGLVMSQMLGLMIARKVLAVEPIASLPADALVVAVTPTIERYLYGALPTPAPKTGTGTRPGPRPEGTA
jgi:AcrR family transcriptional regulator